MSEEGELCEEEEDDRQVKKIKFDEDDFIQFNYQGASFTDFTQGESGLFTEMYQVMSPSLSLRT